MIEYIKIPCSDSSRMAINITKNGEPFGQLWSWKDTKIEQHPWHVRLLNGRYKIEWGKNKSHALKTLKTWVESHA
jgi:hypothetical protein